MPSLVVCLKTRINRQMFTFKVNINKKTEAWEGKSITVVHSKLSVQGQNVTIAWKGNANKDWYVSQNEIRKKKKKKQSYGHLSDSHGNVSQSVSRETAACNNVEYVYLTVRKVQIALKVIVTSLEAKRMTSDSMLIILHCSWDCNTTAVLWYCFHWSHYSQGVSQMYFKAL